MKLPQSPAVQSSCSRWIHHRQSTWLVAREALRLCDPFYRDPTPHDLFAHPAVDYSRTYPPIFAAIRFSVFTRSNFGSARRNRSSDNKRTSRRRRLEGTALATPLVTRCTCVWAWSAGIRLSPGSGTIGAVGWLRVGPESFRPNISLWLRLFCLCLYRIVRVCRVVVSLCFPSCCVAVGGWIAPSQRCTERLLSHVAVNVPSKSNKGSRFPQPPLPRTLP